MRHTMRWVLAAGLVWGFASPAAAAKKLLYVDSYHPEYIWSADIATGIRSVLSEREDVELKAFYMDTKRNQSEEAKQTAALEAKTLIETWQPDVVIAADDNAAKYLIVPYFTNSRLPFVFCGLNWDASVYGFPTPNVTGMTEVALYEPTIAALAGFAKGTRLGYLASDTVSERKEYENIVQRFPSPLDTRFTRTFAELKEAFLELQETTDLVLIQECRSVQGFDHRAMVEFVLQNTRVPTGALQRYLTHYALLTFAKVGEEQGEYAARTALEILGGKSPLDFPVVSNQQAKTYLNLRIAKQLGVKFPVEMLEDAHLISAEPKRVFYVNSYHKGYGWSDDIERGLFKSLGIQEQPDGTFAAAQGDLEFRLYRMDAKRNSAETSQLQAARSARAVIEEWHPDLLLASDDSAAKYLIEPYYKHSPLPVVFCGLNWDAGMYGFPTANVTGLVEVTPVLETIELLRPYARGERLGYIGADVLSERKELRHMQEVLHLSFADGELARTFAQWQAAYTRLQDTVDLLVWLSPAGIQGWDDEQADRFILEHTRIPSGGLGENSVRYALAGKVKIAEEQGWWLGNTALRILDGTSPAAIPVATNQQAKLFLNMALAKRLGVKFPLELVDQATLLECPQGREPQP